MPIEIIGPVDKSQIFCAGSFTKLLTTYVSLSLLSEKYNLTEILDDENFFDKLATNPKAKEFLNLFQKTIGSKFSLRDICNFYAGLPYTFGVAQDELDKVEAGQPFKHHSIPDEKTFLDRCHNNIIPIYPDRSKFHYSELSIIFLGYFLEKAFNVKFEDLYQKFIIKKLNLQNSYFSRTKLTSARCKDFSYKYDYPSIAILDLGYFCYSNGFFTNLNDMKTLLEHIFTQPAFQHMTDLSHDRAASPTIDEGLTVEIRRVGADILYGYEGLSYSGCNIWAYSSTQQKGYLTFTDSEEDAYDIYNEFGYSNFDKVPDHSQTVYRDFLKNYDFKKIQEKDIPTEYQGNYQRVNINDSTLETIFQVGNNFIKIRNPDEITYPVIFTNGNYHAKGKDNLQSTRVELLTSRTGKQYMAFDGTLYRKI